jgi:hypothetical protein
MLASAGRSRLRCPRHAPIGDRSFTRSTSSRRTSGSIFTPTFLTPRRDVGTGYPLVGGEIAEVLLELLWSQRSRAAFGVDIDPRLVDRWVERHPLPVRHAVALPASDLDDIADRHVALLRCGLGLPATAPVARR